MAWYKNGTITISGVTVTGTGTNWTDNKSGIGPGQALLVPAAGTVKIYEILRVDSATKLTLTSSAGTVAAGSAYAIMSFYTESVPDFARRLSAQLSYYQTQMDGWQQIMTSTGSVTLEAPDGTQITLSSFKKLTSDMSNKADLNNGSVAIGQGGTGAKDAAGARANLGLGSAATKDVGTAAGQVLQSGANGLCGTGNRIYGLGNMATFAAARNLGCGFFRNDEVAGVTQRYGAGLFSSVNGSHTMITASAANAVVVVATATDDTLANNTAFANTLYGTANTTRASDGTLKAASPVARIVNSRDETQRTDVAEDGFSWCGCGTANAEAEGINISRLEVGVYVLTGSAGLASSGWQLLPPMDPAGMGELGVVEAEQTESGGLTIRLYKRKYMLNDDGEIIKTKGALMDVPATSWIDVRLDMPLNSIWNQKQTEAVSDFKNTAPEHSDDDLNLSTES